MSDIPHYSVSQLAFQKPPRRPRAEERIAAMSDAVATVFEDMRANILPTDTRSRYDYAAMRSCDLVAVPLVRLGDAANSTIVSVNGALSPRRFLSLKQNIVQRQKESSGDFLLVVVTRSYYRTVFGLQPRATVIVHQHELSPDREWTDDDRARWRVVNQWAARINHGISAGGRRKPNFTRNQVA